MKRRLREDGWTINGIEVLCPARDEGHFHVFHFCPSCGASLKKPVEIKVGMFGRFWDDDKELYVYGVLDGIEDGRPCRYGFSYDNFTPGLPSGFNQDGTVKEVE